MRKLKRKKNNSTPPPVNDPSIVLVPKPKRDFFAGRQSNADKEKEKKMALLQAIKSNPKEARRIVFRKSFAKFVQYFWDTIISDKIVWNWHMDYLCDELQKIVERVADHQPNDGDMIVNVPPGTSKSTIISQMLPVWGWSYWPWLRYLTASYSSALSLEHADRSRQIIRSDKYKELYPHIGIRADKDAKTNFQIEVREFDEEGNLLSAKPAGSRMTTSTGGTITGFHGDLLLVDDPLDPKRAASGTTLEAANDWMDKTLPSRVVSKACSTIILVMQRLHQGDPSGNRIQNQDILPIRHICLPAQLSHHTGESNVVPKELESRYVDNLLDPVRMSEPVLKRQNFLLGDRQYSCQYQQNPKASGASLFHVDRIKYLDIYPNKRDIKKSVRFWDLASTESATSDYSVGVLLALLKDGTYCILDVQRDRKGTNSRNKWIRSVAEMDGADIPVKFEQQPGSAGKDSALSLVRALAGYRVTHALSTGNKSDRADPFASQVNAGNVCVVRADWNKAFFSEFEWFPNAKHDDQVDAASGAFNEIAQGKFVEFLE